MNHCITVMRPHNKLTALRRARLESLEPKWLRAGVTYQGGPLIDHAAVETVYLGQAWTSDAALQQNADRLDLFFEAVTDSSYLDILAEYSTPQGGQIGRGSFAGRLEAPQDDWTGGVVSDQTIRDLLASEIAARVIPPPNGNQLLFVFTPPNVAIAKGGEASNGRPSGFAGYHDSFVDLAGQTVYYAVIPDPIGNDRAPGLSADDQQTMAASHELAEAITDPTLSSWWDDSGDATHGLEIADFANPSTDTVYLGPYAVERVWSNRMQGLQTPAGATLNPSASVAPPAAGGGSQQSLPIPPELGRVAQQFTQVVGYDAALITNAYQQFLGRLPDREGMNYWVARMQAGMSVGQLDAEFIASDEDVRFNGGADAGWIDGLYRGLLNREPDATGLRYWVDQLQAGAGKYAVALGFATSAEREAMIVGNDYQNLLGRSPTAAELAYWSPRLQASPSDAELVASLIGSPEYYNSPAKGRGDASDWVAQVYGDLFNMSAPSGEADWWASQLQNQS